MGFICKNGILLCAQLKTTQSLPHHNHCPHSCKRNVTHSQTILPWRIWGRCCLPSATSSACSPQYTSKLFQLQHQRPEFYFCPEIFQAAKQEQPLSHTGELFKSKQYQYSLENVPKHKDIEVALDHVLAYSKQYRQEVLKTRHNEHPGTLALHRLLHAAAL